MNNEKLLQLIENFDDSYEQAQIILEEACKAFDLAFTYKYFMRDDLQSFNWRVSAKCGKHSHDFTFGIGWMCDLDDKEYRERFFCGKGKPPYTFRGAFNASQWQKDEVETGRRLTRYGKSYKIVTPKTCDLLAALLRDAAVISNYADMYEYAEELHLQKDGQSLRDYNEELTTTWNSCYKAYQFVYKVFGSMVSELTNVERCM